nr:hypothetical protein [Bacilli bacterium]
LSESGALESLNYQEYSGVRYGSSSVGPITCYDGTYKFSIWGGEFSDPYPFSRQIYHEGKYFYRITDYYDEQDREEEKILYTAENEESVLSLSLYYEELSLTGTLLSYLGDKEYSVGFSCLDDISEDGEHTYSYFINQYVDESKEALLKSVTYEKTITVMDNKIVSRVENMENALYAAGEKGNWNIVTTEMSLSYGDYGVYEGEVFSHS